MSDLTLNIMRLKAKFYELVDSPLFWGLARSARLQRVRDLFLRPGGVPELLEEEIEFEHLRFRFTAPTK